jgi:pimeloyl-ACP methyl ester carboxylesterase
MATPHTHRIRTEVGSLEVLDTGGRRPVAVLWHSLFVDNRSWSRVQAELAVDRRLIMITGPGHGASGDPGRRYSMADCAAASITVLDALGIAGPVDWLGNAWGGHVGILVAAGRPDRVRSLTTVGTPVHAYPRRKHTEIHLLLAVHRAVGPIRFLTGSVVDAMLSQHTRATDPDAIAITADGFREADRAGLRNAVVSISLRRPDLTPDLPRIQVPTLFITGADHPDWSPEQARAAARLLRLGSTAVLDDASYLGPLEAPGECVRIVREFWARHDAALTA